MSACGEQTLAVRSQSSGAARYLRKSSGVSALRALLGWERLRMEWNVLALMAGLAELVGLAVLARLAAYAADERLRQ